MAERIALIGGGGHALDVLEVIERAGAHDVVGYYDDIPPQDTGASLTGLEWLGPVDQARHSTSDLVCAIGDPSVRHVMVSRLDGARWAGPLVHPRAEIASETRLDPGTVVMAHAVVSRRVELGAHTHVSQNATIGHESTLGRCVSVFPNAAVSGRVTIDEGVMIGAGAVVLQGLSVGSFAKIGAGAVIVRLVDASSTVVGVGPESC